MINDLTSQINTEEAKQEMRIWLSNVLESEMESLSGTDANAKPEIDIDNELGRLRRGELKNVSDLENILEPRFLDSYIKTIRGNRPGSTESLKNKLNNKLKELANEKKSLKWAETSALMLSDAISEIFEYWEKINVPKTDAGVQNVIKTWFTDLKTMDVSINPLEFGSKKLGKYYDVVKERLSGLLNIIKAYELKTALNELRSDASNRAGRIKGTISSLQGVVKGELLSEPNSLKGHVLASNSIMIPVYASGDMEGDVRTTIGNTIGRPDVVDKIPLGFAPDQIESFLAAAFVRESNQTYTPEYIPLNVWEVVNATGLNTPKDIARNIKVNLMNHNNLGQKIPAANVADNALQRVDDAANLAKGAETGFLTLDQNKIGTTTFVIKNVLGKDQPALNAIANNQGLVNIGLIDISSQTLGDFVAFCVERGNFTLNNLVDPQVWKAQYDDPVIKKDFLLNTFDIDGCAKIQEMRELVQMALYLLITYTIVPTSTGSKASPYLSHATSILAIKPPDRVEFTAFTPKLEISDPVKGGDITKVVEYLAYNPLYEGAFRNRLKVVLNDPNNDINSLTNRLNNLTPVLGVQTVAKLRTYYLGDGGANLGLVAKV
jgi:hypothetical protein